MPTKVVSGNGERLTRERVAEMRRTMPLGRRIKWAREHSQHGRLSHDTLGGLVGTGRRHLIKLEKGEHKPGDELTARIADACGVPVELLQDPDDDDEASLPLSRDEFALLGVLMSRLVNASQEYAR